MPAVAPVELPPDDLLAGLARHGERLVLHTDLLGDIAVVSSAAT